MSAIPRTRAAHVLAALVTTLTIAPLPQTHAAPPTRPHLRWHAVRDVIPLPFSAGSALIASGEMALTADDSHLIVASTASSRLQVIDTDRRHIVDTIAVPDLPDRLWSLQGGRYFITAASFGRVALGWFGPRLAAANDLSIIDGRTLKVTASLRIGENVGHLVDLANGDFLISSVQGRRVTRISASKRELLDDLPLGKERFSPGYLTVHSDGALGVASGGVYTHWLGASGASRPNGEDLLFFDPHAPSERSRLEFFRHLEHPRDLRFLGGHHLLVAERAANRVRVIDWLTRRSLHTFDIGARPDRFGELRPSILYVLLDGESALSLIDLRDYATRQLRTPGLVSSPPVHSRDGRFLYVPITAPASIAVYDTATETLVDHFAVSAPITDLKLSHRGHRLYAFHREDNNVSIIE